MRGGSGGWLGLGPSAEQEVDKIQVQSCAIAGSGGGGGWGGGGFGALVVAVGRAGWGADSAAELADAEIIVRRRLGRPPALELRGEEPDT